MEVAKEVFEIKRRSTLHSVVRRLYAPGFLVHTFGLVLGKSIGAGVFHRRK